MWLNKKRLKREQCDYTHEETFFLLNTDMLWLELNVSFHIEQPFDIRAECDFITQWCNITHKTYDITITGYNNGHSDSTLFATCNNIIILYHGLTRTHAHTLL